VGRGAFGDVDLAEYLERGIEVAVKCNGTACANGAAIENERGLYEVLLGNPHDNIVPVYGICTDAADGKARIVMKFCEKGSLDDYLVGVAKHEVGLGCVCASSCAVMSPHTHCQCQ
jgi:serine/threonine protein kinase